MKSENIFPIVLFFNLFGALKLNASLDFTGGSQTGSNSASCPAGSVHTSGTCGECPSGQYTYNTTLCEACPVGSYSSAGSTNCTECTKGTSTLSEESTSSDECIVVCSVPTLNNTYSVQPAPSTNVVPSTNVTVMCSNGFQYNNDNYYIKTCSSDLPNCISITTTTLDKIVLSSSSLTLSCVVVGAMPDTGIWYRKGAVISGGGNYTKINSSTYVSTLTIPSPSHTDNGQYKCKAKVGGVLEMSKGVQITLLSITSYNTTTLYLFSGSSSTINCTIYSPSLVSISSINWYKGETFLTQGTITSTSGAFKTSMLALTNVDLTNTGLYRCQGVYPGYGRITSGAKLVSVIGFKTSPTTVVIRAGSATSLVCETVGSDTVSNITWSLNNELLDSFDWSNATNTSEVHCTVSKEYNISYALTDTTWSKLLTTVISISNATDNHAGLYQCTVEYDNVSLSDSANITVLDLGIVQNPHDISLEVGMNTSLVCVFDSPTEYTIVSIDWHKGVKTYTNDSTTTTSRGTIITTRFSQNYPYQDGYSQSMLIFTTAGVEENGLYYCQVTYDNPNSTDNITMNSTAAKLYVLGISTQPTNVVGGEGSNVTLSCTLGGYVETVIWRSDNQTYNISSGVTVQEMDPVSLTTVTKLVLPVPQNNSQFSVTASNSQYSVTSQIRNITVYSISIYHTYAILGSMVTLTALIDAPTTTDSVAWFSGTNKMTEASNTTFNGSYTLTTITINNVTDSSAVYTCNAYLHGYTVEIQSKGIQITFLDFAVSPVSYGGVKGGNTTLYCKVTEEPAMYNMSWYFNDVAIKGYGNNTSYTLQSLQYNQTGHYQCRAVFQGIHGELRSQKGFITVSGVEVYGHQPRYLTQGSTITCMAHVSEHGGEVVWVKEDGTVLTSNKSSNTTIVSVLTITTTTPTTTQAYKCKVKDGGLNQTFTSSTFNSYAIQTPPYTPTTGNTITLTCTCNVAYSYTVGWFNNELRLKNSSLYIVSNAGDRAGFKTLTLTIVQPTQDDTFTCAILVGSIYRDTSNSTVDYIDVTATSNVTRSGVTVELTCTVNNTVKEPDEIKWLNIPYPGSKSWKSTYNNRSQSMSSILQITQPSKDTVVTCSVWYGAMVSSVNTSLDVIDITAKGTTTNSEQATISCIVQNTQTAPDVLEWFHDNAKVVNGSNIAIYKSNLMSKTQTLTLTTNTTSDIKYTCNVQYNEGLKWSHAAGIDSISTSLLGIRIKQGDTATLTCVVHGAQSQPVIQWSNTTLKKITTTPTTIIHNSTYGTWLKYNYQNSTLTLTGITTDSTYTCVITQSGQKFQLMYTIIVSGISILHHKNFPKLARKLPQTPAPNPPKYFASPLAPY